MCVYPPFLGTMTIIVPVGEVCVIWSLCTVVSVCVPNHCILCLCPQPHSSSTKTVLTAHSVHSPTHPPPRPCSQLTLSTAPLTLHRDRAHSSLCPQPHSPSTETVLTAHSVHSPTHPPPRPCSQLTLSTAPLTLHRDRAHSSLCPQPHSPSTETVLTAHSVHSPTHPPPRPCSQLTLSTAPLTLHRDRAHSSLCPQPLSSSTKTVFTAQAIVNWWALRFFGYTSTSGYTLVTCKVSYVFKQ